MNAPTQHKSSARYIVPIVCGMILAACVIMSLNSVESIYTQEKRAEARAELESNAPTGEMTATALTIGIVGWVVIIFIMAVAGRITAFFWLKDA